MLMMKCYSFSKNSPFYAAHFDTPPAKHKHQDTLAHGRVLVRPFFFIRMRGLSFRLAFFVCVCVTIFCTFFPCLPVAFVFCV